MNQLAHKDHPLRHYDRTCPACREAAKGKAAYVLTAALCALPEVEFEDGHDYIRRDRVMDLIASWRRSVDGK